MSTTSPPRLLVSEVGPRDGLQSISRTMPTAAKKAWISALAAAGLREIEVCSFVPPRLLPKGESRPAPVDTSAPTLQHDS